MANHFRLPGKIYFTAIGPGAAKQLTLRTLELLRGADLVVHDDVVPEDVLELIPARVAVQRIGKEFESNPLAREGLQRRMVEAAQNGQRVVRLMFGGQPSDAATQREITTLRHAGVEADVLLGTTPATGDADASNSSLTPEGEQPPASRNFETISLDLPRSTTSQRAD
jgi:uroporphyrin-III C-methyltransferase